MIRYILAGLIKKFKELGIESLITAIHSVENTYPVVIITQGNSTILNNSIDNSFFEVNNNDGTFSRYKTGGETVTQLKIKLYDTSLTGALQVNSLLKKEFRNTTIKLSLKNIEIDLTNSEKEVLFDVNSVNDEIFNMEVFYEKEESFLYTESGKPVWCFVHSIEVTYNELPTLVETIEGITIIPNIELINK